MGRKKNIFVFKTFSAQIPHGKMLEYPTKSNKK